MNPGHQISNAQRRVPGWSTRCLWAVVAVVLLSVALDLRAQTTNNASGPTYDSFNIISRRNIFDPNRRGIRPWTPRTANPAPDVLALVGTMSYAKGKFAFFDGTKSDYKKVLEPGATIAGYTIKDITPKDITLAANGKDLTLSVGSQMRKEGNDWKPSTQSDLPSASDTNTGSSGSASDQSMPSGANPAANDIIKRLMEQRQQLLK